MKNHEPSLSLAFLALGAYLFYGCSSYPKPTHEITDFFSFCGIKSSDSPSALRKMLGAPEKVGYPDPDLYYFLENGKPGLKITFFKLSDKGRIDHVILSSPKAAQRLRNIGVKDPQMDLLGKTSAEIIQAYGKPWLGKHGDWMLMYRFIQGDRKGFVTFECAGSDRVCEKIDAFWLD